MPLPPSSLSAMMHTNPVTTTTVMPRTTPGNPAVTTDFRLIVWPRVNAMNGTMIGSCEPKNCLMSSSRLPSTAPARIGSNHREHRQPRNDREAGADENQHRQERAGLDALHDVGARVFLVAHDAGEREEHAAVGVAHRHHHGQRAQPEHVAAEVIARSPGRRAVAVPTLAARMPPPRSSMRGAARNVIFVPTVKRYIPRTVG